MIATFARVLFGFVLACIAAGLTQILFVTTPAELAAGPVETLGDRTVQTLIWGLLAATHAAVFAAAFALIAVGVGEALKIRSWAYYLMAGIGIALLGFYTQLMTETLGQATVLNLYALAAFASAGAMGGLVYWLAAGRRAGGSSAAPDRGSHGKRRLVVEDATVDVTTANKPKKSLAERLARAENDEPASTSTDKGDTTSVRVERTAKTGPSVTPRTAD